MNTFTRRRVAVLALAAAAALALGGCASGQTPAGAAGATQAVGTPIQVKEHEYAIVLSQDTFTAGAYAFELSNDGTVVHNLNISGPGIKGTHSGDIMPGKTSVLNVTLEPGTYELWCSIGNHRANGMDITITVK